MTTNFMKRGQDSLLNGTLLGAAAGFLIVYSQTVYDFIVPLIPESWQIFGEFSIPIILVTAFAGIGYAVDRM